MLESRRPPQRPASGHGGAEQQRTRLYPIPLPLVGHGQLLRLIGDTTMALDVLRQHDIIHGDA